MKPKKILCLIAALMIVASLSGCRESYRVSRNLSLQADNFNVVRRVIVINCIQGDVLFTMEGKMSINADVDDHQLEITVEDIDGTYKKHFIGLSDNVTYVVEDVDVNEVEKYRYTLNLNPKMWIPVEIESIE